MILCGLRNEKNNCAIYTFIQCISSLLDIYKLPTTDLNKYKISGNLRILIQQMSENRGKIIKPLKFLKEFFEESGDRFIQGRQHDITELWTFIIDKMHDELISDSKLITHFQDDIHKNAYDYLNTFYKNKTSYIRDKFTGSYITVVKCLECDYKSITYEPFTTISIPIGNSIVSEISKIFTKIEFEKNHSEAWTCSICEKKVKSAKCTKIWSIPEILVITLNRYDDNRRKLTDAVQINKKIIFNKKTIINDPNLSANYKLHAIGLHHGEYGGGHYTTLKYENEKNIIYHIDDENISLIRDDDEVNEKLLHNTEAYIIVYTQ
jgi:ubiquitin C-terminal hydrolase